MDADTLRIMFSYGVPTGLLLILLFGLWKILQWGRTKIAEPVIKSHLELIDVLKTHIPIQTESINLLSQHIVEHTKRMDEANIIMLKNEESILQSGGKLSELTVEIGKVASEAALSVTTAATKAAVAVTEAAATAAVAVTTAAVAATEAATEAALAAAAAATEAAAAAASAAALAASVAATAVTDAAAAAAASTATAVTAEKKS